MLVANKALVLDLLEWVAAAPRPYDEVMGAWRTSCPRLPIWEDTLELGFVALGPSPAGRGRTVTLTAAGRAFLASERPPSVMANV